MKKLMITMLAGISTMGMVTFANNKTNNTNIAATDVYSVKMSLKVPYLNNGVRAYASQSMKGSMYMVYNEFADLIDAYMIVQNTKTKIEHKIVLDVGNFVRLGKANKRTEHTVPCMTAVGADIPSNSINQGHEFISEVAFAGYGSLREYKLTDCESCGGTDISYCYLINKMSGSVLGVMDCLCDDNTSWNHTVGATRCDDEGQREHNAPFFGTWSAEYNKKLSNTVKFIEKKTQYID